MHMRRSVGVLATVVAGALWAVCVPSAHASATVAVDLSGFGPAVTGATPNAVTATRIRITNSTPIITGTNVEVVSSELTKVGGSQCTGFGNCMIVPGASAEFDVAATASLSPVSVITATQNTTPYFTPFTVTYGSVPSPSPEGGGANATPPAVLQQFGRPASLTCLEAQPEGLNIGGVDSGGWGNSWAQWMNEGTGGFVCTRTLIYSNAHGHWVVD